MSIPNAHCTGGARAAARGRLARAGAHGLALLVGACLCVAAAAQTLVVDLNSANAAQLAEAIRGVGAAKAAAIVEYRERYGSFERVDDLIDVPGIGLRTIERNRDALRVGPAEAPSPLASESTATSG